MFSESSDSDDDVQIKQFLEAADSTLLNDSLFQKDPASASGLHTLSKPNVNEFERGVTDTKPNGLPKSQRYLSGDEFCENGVRRDLILPDAVQKHITKKMKEILNNKYEFCNEKIQSVQKIDKYKSPVKLLSDADCYVNAYEDFQCDNIGPRKKPTLKRRSIDYVAENTKESFKILAVDSSYILNGCDLKYWAPKKERLDRVFHYKMDNRGVLYAKENLNEFSFLRQRNQWNESKIKYRNYDKIPNST